MLDWLEAKHMKRARDCSDNAIWITESIAEHAAVEGGDISDWVLNVYKEWRMCM